MFQIPFVGCFGCAGAIIWRQVLTKNLQGLILTSSARPSGPAERGSGPSAGISRSNERPL